MEDLTLNVPKPKGQAIKISCFVDSDHGGDQINQISRTRILVLLNSDLIMFYLKQKNTVNNSTFCSEFLAINQAVEMLKSPRYKLQMFGIEIMENETKMYCDNNSIILNESVPE